MPFHHLHLRAAVKRVPARVAKEYRLLVASAPQQVGMKITTTLNTTSHAIAERKTSTQL
jgi:hypothetical protein